MSFSLFQPHLPFRSVFKYLRFLPPGSEQSPEDWSGKESEQIKLGDIIFVLEPVFSQFANASQGIGVSEGDKFTVTQLLLAFRLDAGYPMCLALSPDAYEMQFVETVLCVKADMARLAGHGFYYLLARPKNEPSANDLAQIGDMHKYGNNGSRLQPPKGLPEPGMIFLSNLHAPMEASFAKEPINMEMLAYYLFTDNDTPAGKAPDLNGVFVPVKKGEGIEPAAAKKATAPEMGKTAANSNDYSSQSLNALLSDDWTPEKAAAAAAAAAPPPALPPEKPVRAGHDQDSVRGMAAEIASLVGGLKDVVEPDPKAKIQMAPSPGIKQTPPAPQPLPTATQARTQLQPPSHPLRKPGISETGQHQAIVNAAVPPGPVPMHGSGAKPAEKKVTLEALLSGDVPALPLEPAAPSFVLGGSAAAAPAQTPPPAKPAAPPPRSTAELNFLKDLEAQKVQTPPAASFLPSAVQTSALEPAATPPVIESTPVASPPAVAGAALPGAAAPSAAASTAEVSPQVSLETPAPVAPTQVFATNSQTTASVDDAALTAPATPATLASTVAAAPKADPFSGVTAVSAAALVPPVDGIAPAPTGPVSAASASSTPAQPEGSSPPVSQAEIAASLATTVPDLSQTAGLVSSGSTPAQAAAAPSSPAAESSNLLSQAIASAPPASSVLSASSALPASTTPPVVSPTGSIASTESPAAPGSAPTSSMPASTLASNPFVGAEPAPNAVHGAVSNPFAEAFPATTSAPEFATSGAAKNTPSDPFASALPTASSPAAPAAVVPEPAVACATGAPEPTVASAPATGAPLPTMDAPATGSPEPAVTAPPPLVAPTPAPAPFSLGTVELGPPAPAPAQSSSLPADSLIPGAVPLNIGQPSSPAHPFATPAETPATAPATTAPAPVETTTLSPFAGLASTPAVSTSASTASAPDAAALTQSTAAASQPGGTPPVAAPIAGSPFAVPAEPAPALAQQVSPASPFSGTPLNQPASTPLPSTSALPGTSSVSPGASAASPAAPSPQALAAAGVGSHVAKLEQQAQRATAKLEQKLDEVHLRLQHDLNLNLSKVQVKEKASLANVDSLRSVLVGRLNKASDDVKIQTQELAEKGCQTIRDSSATESASITDVGNGLGQEVLQPFDELSKSTLVLSASYAERADAIQQQGLSELTVVLQSMLSKLEDTGRQYSVLTQEHFDLLQKRLSELNDSSVSDLSSTYTRLQGDLLTHKNNCMLRLDVLTKELLDTIKENVDTCKLSNQMHSDAAATNVLIPRLMAFRQSIGSSAQKLREKYKEEVEKSATMKFAELRPIFVNSREKMEAVVIQAQELKLSIEVGQKAEFEKMLTALSLFVDEKITQAKGLSDLSASELSQIEKNVIDLSDAAGIESDPELAAARAKVLSKLQDIGTQLQNKVNDSLRRQIAGMEDKGKILQEELISGMEGDAYAVRKSVELSVNKVKQALQQAEASIQSLQNHYLQ